MRPHGDDLYLGVAVALVVTSAVVAAMFTRRFGRRPRVAGAAVAAMVLLLLAVQSRRTADVSMRDVVGATDLRTERLRRPSAPALEPAPPVMRRVPIATTSTAPATPRVRAAPRPAGDRSPGPTPLPPAPASAPAPPPPPAASSTVPPPVVVPPVPTTVTVTTTTPGDG